DRRDEPITSFRDGLYIRLSVAGHRKSAAKLFDREVDRSVADHHALPDGSKQLVDRHHVAVRVREEDKPIHRPRLDHDGQIAALEEVQRRPHAPASDLDRRLLGHGPDPMRYSLALGGFSKASLDLKSALAYSSRHGRQGPGSVHRGYSRFPGGIYVPNQRRFP